MPLVRNTQRERAPARYSGHHCFRPATPSPSVHLFNRMTTALLPKKRIRPFIQLQLDPLPVRQMARQGRVKASTVVVMLQVA